MKKNNKKNNINIITIWKAFRSEKGKTYSFIIFYFFFFIFLFIFINTGNQTINKEDNKIDNQVEESSLPFVTKNLENNNYEFKYIINANLEEFDYKGEKINNKIYINDDTGEYIFNYQNGNLIANENNNILHTELFDIYNIKRIIKSSKLISETKLNETNEYIFNYNITNANLSYILKDNINNLEKINDIKIKTKENKEIKSIEFDLINYESELNNELKVFKILLEIGDINE